MSNLSNDVGSAMELCEKTGRGVVTHGSDQFVLSPLGSSHPQSPGYLITWLDHEPKMIATGHSVSGIRRSISNMLRLGGTA